ncbi:MAG: transglycosylase SLT domain-containing protein [Ignavibacteriales bacterium]|nr:transglycosylase SLT domain-containing protein [Ignavibacteriales bacterium]
MDPTLNISSAATNGIKPDKMDAKAKVRLQRAVQDFEAVFVGYLLKTMRQSVPKEEGEGGGFGGEMMESVFDMELSKHISRNSNLGLAEMMYRKLTGEPLPKVHEQLVPPKQTESQSVGVVTPTTPAKATTKKIESFSDATLVSAGASHPARPASLAPSVPPAADTLKDRLDGLNTIISSAAEQHGLNPNLLKAIIATESGGVAHARSSQNAKGLMQLIDSTATAMGVSNVWDPRQNIDGGSKYLKKMMERFGGDIRLALASYNAGPGAVEKHGGIPPYKETQKYVKRVMDYLNYFESAEAGGNEED